MQLKDIRTLIWLFLAALVIGAAGCGPSTVGQAVSSPTTEAGKAENSDSSGSHTAVD